MVPAVARKISIVCLSVLICGAVFVARQVSAASPLYVRPAGDDVLCNGTVDVDYSVGVAPACAFETVQKGIDDVDVGGQVNIGDGTYVEQLEIDKDLSLFGNGSATVIESPAILTKSFMTTAANKPIIWVHDADDVNLFNFVVDGAGLGNANARFTGVAYHNAGGLIGTLEIKNMANTPRDGAQHGVGIYAIIDDAVARHIDTYDCTIYGYQKNGMAFDGDDLSVEIVGNDVTGSGPTTLIAQNGIQVSRGATGIVRDNIVRDNWCASSTGGCTDDPTSSATADGASGILLYAAGDSVEIRDNIIVDNQYNIWSVASVDVDIIGNEVSGDGGVGIAIWDADQWTTVLGLTETGTSGSIQDNTITGMEYGILFRDYEAGGELLTVQTQLNRFVDSSTCPVWSDITVDATNNWWGDNTPSFALDPCGSIVYDPWLQLNVTADQDSPEVGTDVEISASLRINSDGEDVYTPDSMLDELAIGFASQRGSLSAESSPLLNGIATVILTGIDEPGPVTVSATLDNQTTELSLDFVGGGDDEGGTDEILTFASGGGFDCRIATSAPRHGIFAFLVFISFILGLVVFRSKLTVK